MDFSGSSIRGFIQAIMVLQSSVLTMNIKNHHTVKYQDDIKDIPQRYIYIPILNVVLFVLGNMACYIIFNYSRGGGQITSESISYLHLPCRKSPPITFPFLIQTARGEFFKHLLGLQRGTRIGYVEA